MAEKLTTDNANTFWTNVWATGSTGWRLGEVRKPFTRNIFLALKHLTGETPQALQTATFPFEVTKDIHDDGMYNGIDEVSAVEAFLSGKTVLVPLCGDTEVVPYLANHGAAVVIGSDLSEEALMRQMKDNFAGVPFSARQITVEPADSASGEKSSVLTIHEAALDNGSKVLLFQGDFLAAKDCPDFTSHKVQFVYDRAALMAMNPQMREPYVRTIASVLDSEKAKVLIERPVRAESDLSGPPFGFKATDVVTLYEKATPYHVKCDAAAVDAWRIPPPDAPTMGTVKTFEWLVATFSK